MKTYQCYKRVKAAQITGILPVEDSDRDATLCLDDGETFRFEDAAMARADVVLVERMAILTALIERLAAIRIAGGEGGTDEAGDQKRGAAGRGEAGRDHGGLRLGWRQRGNAGYCASALSVMASGEAVGA